MAPTPQPRPQELINVKLLLIGNSSVGKSSLLLRFSDKQWLPEDEASATIGVDFKVRPPVSPDCTHGDALLGSVQVHKMEVNGRKVKMSIWVRSVLGSFRALCS